MEASGRKELMNALHACALFWFFRAFKKGSGGCKCYLWPLGILSCTLGSVITGDCPTGLPVRRLERWPFRFRYAIKVSPFTSVSGGPSLGRLGSL